MQNPRDRDESDTDQNYAQNPCPRLSVECGETRQNRGILVAFSGAHLALNARRSAWGGPSTRWRLEVPGSDDPGPAVTPPKTPQHADHVNLLPFGPPSTLQWLLLS